MNLDVVMDEAFWDRVAREVCSRVSGTNGVMLLIFWGILVFAAVFTYARDSCAALDPWAA